VLKFCSMVHALWCKCRWVRVRTRLSHGMSNAVMWVGRNARLVALWARVRRGRRGAAVLLHGALALRRKRRWGV
jgi:hypothetical protein